MSHQTQQPRQIGLAKPQTASPTVQLSVQVRSDEDYLTDPCLEPYDVFLARTHATNQAAVSLYRKASNRDAVTASTMRAAADLIWRKNIASFQNRFTQRGVK